MPNVLQHATLPPTARFAIVVAEWNKNITSKLLDGAVAKFTENEIADDRIDVAWVPGAWEIPLVAKRMAASGNYSAVLCLGAVIRGETTHDEYINRGVSLAFSQIALEFDLPVLFGVLTCNTLEQAIHRAGGNVGNKGSECAEAALAMVGLLEALPHSC
ncbi:MAG: 6,7-dimethyl-8-ribityllumazine synthase [Aeoliella sp.]